MARQQSQEFVDRAAIRERAKARPFRAEAAFRKHLVIYLVTGLFLLTLNLLTGPGELWFYWPLFFWGWALVFQAVFTYGTEAPWRVVALLRSIIPERMTTAPAPVSPRARGSNPFAATAFASLHERIEGLKEIAKMIPEGSTRDQAVRICGAADRIAGAMAADRTDAETVSWFNDRLLKPTQSLLTGYVRLSSRGVTGADETLRRIEDQNLPAIKSRLDALYDQLHRGEIVDLAVTSEMLDFELTDSLLGPRNRPN